MAKAKDVSDSGSMQVTLKPSMFAVKARRNKDNSVEVEIPLNVYQKITAIKKGEEFEVSASTLLTGASGLLASLMKK